MTIIYEPRAGDARALVVSLGLGALIGAAIAGAYLVGGIAREAVSKPLMAQANGVQIPSPAANGAATQTAALSVAEGGLSRGAQIGAQAGPPPKAEVSSHQLSSLRDRFSLALALTRSVVQPFHFKSADAGAEDHSRDTQCLAQAVYYEARGESASGQAAVAQVVLNRVRHPAFPKTVCGVVFQHVGADCQFSFACNGAMRQPLDRVSWRRAMAVADRALSGAVMAQVGAATHFQAARSEAGWAGDLARVAQIGEHIFYRFTGRAGTPRMFQAEPQRSAPNVDGPIKIDDGRTHAVFEVATAVQTPSVHTDLKPVPAPPGEVKPSAVVAAAPTGSATSPGDPSAKAQPLSAAPVGESVQPVKAVEAEKAKPIAAASTQS